MKKSIKRIKKFRKLIKKAANMLRQKGIWDKLDTLYVYDPISESLVKWK